jgi:hypothetical protein
MGQNALATVTGDELTTALNELFTRIKKFKTGDERGWDFCNYKPIDSAFNGADLLLLDNNLTLLDNEGPPLTAESIAGYIRAFTSARYIISLNMNPDVDFDLRYLVGDFLTRADLAVNAEHIANKYLWTGDPEDALDAFAPWYWPRLHDAADYRTRQIAFVRDNFDQAVLPSLGFNDATAFAMLSRHALGALSPKAAAEHDAADGGRALNEITFRDFFLAKNRSLPLQNERDRLNSAYAENDAVREIVARIVAADVDLWLRRDVLGPQEPLVDVPHLTARLPFLLGDRAAEISTWNGVISQRKPPFGWERRVYDEFVAERAFEHQHVWSQKTCFWWSKLNDDDRVNERLLAPSGSEWADVVFCEDTSRFEYRLGGADREPPVEFVAEFEGVWNRRHVARLPDIRYAPLTRLAM